MGPGIATVDLPTATTAALRHCRCIDCRNFSRVGQDYFCSHYIGGTKVTWATGKRECDPPPEAWHYCACYDGPQVSKDVWVWPRRPACRSLGVGRSRHVPPGSTIAPQAEQGHVHANHQTGQDGRLVNGSFPGT